LPIHKRAANDAPAIKTFLNRFTSIDEKENAGSIRGKTRRLSFTCKSKKAYLKLEVYRRLITWQR